MIRVALLAAGVGARPDPSGQAPSRALLRLAGRSLQRHIPILRSFGLGDVTLVAGHRARAIEREIARMAGRTSAFGRYGDRAAGGAVLIAPSVGSGSGLQGDRPGAWPLGLGVGAGLATAAICALRLELERADKEATRLPNSLGGAVADVMDLVGPVTRLGPLQPLLVLAASGAQRFALLVLWPGRRVLLEQRT